MRKLNTICQLSLILSLIYMIGSFEAWAAPPKPLPPKKIVMPPPPPPPVRKPIKQRFKLAPLPSRPAPPAAGYVWVERYMHPSGKYVGGFWRPQHKPGYLWIKGYWNDEGDWIFGFWKPEKPKVGHVWEPGYWDGIIWIEGYWRVEEKPDFIWVPGHFNSKGIWVKGHWQKK